MDQCEDMWAVRKATFGAEGSLTAFVRHQQEITDYYDATEKTSSTWYPKQWRLCAPRTATATMWLLKTEPCMQARVMKGWSIKQLRGTLKRKCLAIYYNHVVFENLKNSQNPQSKQTTIVGMPGLHHTYFKQATMGENWMQSNGTWTGMKVRWWTILQGSLEALPTSLEFTLRQKLQACPSSNNFKFSKLNP